MRGGEAFFSFHFYFYIFFHFKTFCKDDEVKLTSKWEAVKHKENSKWSISIQPSPLLMIFILEFAKGVTIVTIVHILSIPSKYISLASTQLSLLLVLASSRKCSFPRMWYFWVVSWLFLKTGEPDCAESFFIALW